MRPRRWTSTLDADRAAGEEVVSAQARNRITRQQEHERIARATAGKGMERGLARQLESIAPPVDGLIAWDADPLSLFAPGRGRAS